MRPSLTAMTAARQRLGRLGEDLVAEELEATGSRILARNVRVTGIRGELDLIALEGRTLVFVEVKTLRAGSVTGPERPALAVGRRKQMKLRSLARAWLAERRGSLRYLAAIRFDVVGLRLDPGGGVVEWEHIKGAF
jgi:putative endonuclease